MYNNEKGDWKMHPRPQGAFSFRWEGGEKSVCEGKKPWERGCVKCTVMKKEENVEYMWINME